VLGDTLSSFAVIAGGVAMILTGNYLIDPLLSILIAILIVYHSLGLLRESVDILMERSPKHIDLDKLTEDISSVEGVEGIHDLHVWSICSNVHALNAHLLVSAMSVKDTEKLTAEINRNLSEKYNITHTTLQYECTDCGVEGVDDNNRNNSKQ
jgi:cobalt-zinc-cadmium efflux system protein